MFVAIDLLKKGAGHCIKKNDIWVLWNRSVSSLPLRVGGKWGVESREWRVEKGERRPETGHGKANTYGALWRPYWVIKSTHTHSRTLADTQHTHTHTHTQ